MKRMPRCRKPFIICWSVRAYLKFAPQPVGERKSGMDRVNRILHNPKYRECVEKNRKYEEERIFCRHDMSHFLDVARLSWIENLEKGLGIEKELIYAAARPMSLPEHSWRRRFFLTAALRNRSGRKSSGRFQGTGKKSWHRRRACAGCFTGRIRKAGPALHARRKAPAAGRPPKRTFC